MNEGASFKMADDNAQVIRRFFEEVFTKGNFDYIDEIIGPDYTFNGRPSSAERTKTWAKRKRKRYKNIKFQIERLTAVGRIVTFGWIMRGEDTESFGEEVVRMGSSELAFRNGRCVANRQSEAETNNTPPIARA
jgi:SnoaL-like polyketide cyclase